MPLRIAIAGAIAICACMVIPVSVNAVSSQDGMGDSAEDAEPPEPEPSSPPVASVLDTERAVGGVLHGASIHAAGYSGGKSWMTLLVLIVAGFLPSGLMIFRSTQRRRAGPAARLE